nr:unnamed protein product [Callosobruchus analis]
MIKLQPRLMSYQISESNCALDTTAANLTSQSNTRMLGNLLG